MCEMCIKYVTVRWRLWALEFSRSVGANACSHFEWWGWPIDEETRTECQTLPDMENLMEEHLGTIHARLTLEKGSCVTWTYLSLD